MLSWGASSGATAYHVKRGTSGSGPFTQVSAPTSTSYTDTGLANGTAYYYVVTALNSAGESGNSSVVGVTPAAAANPDVTVTVNPSITHSISPYVYGLNSATSSGMPSGIPFDRAGGNRWTAYNWENNASNAGSDYLYESDAYLSSSSTPAEAARAFIAADRNAGMASLVTLQMQGLVAADESGSVDMSNPPDMSRFKQVVFQKSTQSAAAFTTAPPTSDSYVYMDEFVWALDQKFSGQSIFGATPATQPVFLELDNEPELWNSTHKEIQGSTAITSDAYISKTVSLTKAIKTQFPNAVVFGPVHYGFLGIYNWQTEMSGATPSGNNWFADKYLAAVKAASTAFGRALVDVYDFHWYTQITDSSGNQLVSNSSSSLTADQVQAIVQAPRSLWDTSYKENSWIANDVLSGPIYILPRLQSRIDSTNPGMKIAITEYNTGGSQHIAGTIAESDTLGVYGVQGVYAANYWPLNGSEPYILGGFRAFRNFDGASASFGDISLQAVSSNTAAVSAYASKDSTRSGRVVFVAINRSTSSKVTQLTGAPLSGTAHLYQMTAASAQGQSTVRPVAAGTQSVSGSSLTVTLPALSVTTIDVY